MNNIDQGQTIIRTVVPEEDRCQVVEDLFGIDFPLRLEPLIFHIAGTMAPSYTGGYWAFFTLSNGGFYLAPEGPDRYLASSMNGWSGGLSADALGITVCLTAYSHLSFGGPPAFARRCAEHYHRLRDYMLEHGEAGPILAATD
ncbi:antirestriction protein [Pseudohaliea sp.]|uniref:antirestriction protein n=1 Tax=Pseudohaliea sp. TaxID=2740289 RepID=UPI0032EC21C3